MAAKPIEQNHASNLVLLCLAAWLIPGVGHIWLGRRNTGLIFFAALITMFVIGVAVDGRIFPFVLSDPLAGLMALAEAGIGLPRFLANGLGRGMGEITAATYEYGNTFLIVAGLLNLLVVIDAYDIASGRKP